MKQACAEEVGAGKLLVKVEVGMLTYQRIFDRQEVRCLECQFGFRMVAQGWY